MAQLVSPCRKLNSKFICEFSRAKIYWCDTDKLKTLLKLQNKLNYADAFFKSGASLKASRWASVGCSVARVDKSSSARTLLWFSVTVTCFSFTHWNYLTENNRNGGFVDQTMINDIMVNVLTWWCDWKLLLLLGEEPPSHSTMSLKLSRSVAAQLRLSYERLSDKNLLQRRSNEA